MTGDSQAAVPDLVRADPAHALVALDVDGTLAPIVSTPEDARAVPGTVAALRALLAAGTTVVLISGRPAADAARIVGLSDGDDVTVLGQYGLQRWRAGQLETPPPEPGIDEVRRRLPELLAGAPEGVHIEDKQHALVVHTRPAADPVAALAVLRRPLTELAERLGLQALPGRAVLEIRPAGTDKGGALRSAVEAADPQVVVYVGDDVADLEAFAELRRLSREGRRVLAVASVDPAGDDSDPQVAAAADLVLDGPKAVVDWLRGLAQPTG